MCGRYIPDWGMWEDGANFAASLWTSAMTDCEVDACIYEVGLHERLVIHNFAPISL